jgi:cytoskeletal protein RodZ
MNLTVYVIAALLAIAAFVIAAYGINDNVAATSIIAQQQSSGSSQSSSITQQQSSGSSQSSSTSDSVIISESSGDESVSSSNRIVTSTSTDNLQIDRQSSGKIASSRLNLTSGEVEAVLFGDWSLNSTSGFATSFIYRPSNASDSIQYGMSGLDVHSVNRINENLVLAGTIDVVSNSGAVLQDAPVTIMIQNGILVVGFGDATETANLFGGMPIIGFEQ